MGTIDRRLYWCYLQTTTTPSITTKSLSKDPAAKAAGSASRRTTTSVPPSSPGPSDDHGLSYMPKGAIEFWDSLKTRFPKPVNPRYDPSKDDGTGRYRIIQYKHKCVARCNGPDALARQSIRNCLRWEDPLTYAGEADELMDILRKANVSSRLPDTQTQTRISEWLSIALRHKPFHRGGVSQRFRDAVWSYDEYDGWVHIPDLIKIWPPKHQTNFHNKFLEHVDTWLYDQHQAYQVLVILMVSEVVDRQTGMQKNRLQVKKAVDLEGGETCYYLRASNGHTYPGPRCPESLYSPVTERTLKTDDAPAFFMHGTRWENIPGILRVGLSCLGHDNPKNKDGRQFIHGCPYLPGDDRIQSGLRQESEVILMISVSQLIRDHVKVWRSANDIVMTSGINGRRPVSYIMQMIGVKHDPKYKYDRTGEIWCWTQNKNEETRDDDRCDIHGQAISKWEYEVENDPTTDAGGTGGATCKWIGRLMDTCYRYDGYVDAYFQRGRPVRHGPVEAGSYWTAAARTCGATCCLPPSS